MSAFRARAILCVSLTVVACRQPLSAAPAPVTEFPIHADGGIIYDPLRREAEKTHVLEKFREIARRQGAIASGPCRLTFDIPEGAEAYDVVPVGYELSWDEAAVPSFPLAVEATAFEDEPRRRHRDLFDLALPGRIDLDFDFVGSVTAHLRSGGRHNLEPDCSDRPARYPPFDCRPMTRSGVVEAGDLVWLRIRYTNTGNTILDPEGFGGCLFTPHLLRKGNDGKYELVGRHYNLHIRDLEYLYPGESHETWMNFQTLERETPEGMGLVPGEYLLRVRLMYRCYKTPDVFLNIWEGPEAVVWDLPFTVEPQARQVPVAEGRKTLADGGQTDKLTRFIHTFEEFMTAFDCHQSPAAVNGNRIAGTLHLQVAPWTKHVVVKLIGADPLTIATKAVPIAVSDRSLRFKPDLDPTEYVIRDGRREPLFVSQTMADMRSNIQLGPHPEHHIRERLREMLDCGINMVATTSMPWLYDDMHKPPSNHNGDAMKYFMEVARREGMQVEGWGTYPFDRSTIESIAGWLTGEPWQMEHHAAGGYEAISLADPLLPKASMLAWMYQLCRWGDLYYQSPRGGVLFSVEDTRGWMRQDVNVRHPMGERMIEEFRNWLRAQYGTIEAVNDAWETSFSSFDTIEPEKKQVANPFGHRWEYTDRSHAFHDWNDAVADLDAFRTDMRIRNYREMLRLLRREIPNAVLVLRTEGANAIVAGLDPHNPNPHLRHVYYSQRRCALIAERLGRAGVFAYHSDYTTIPYTPSELRELVSAGVSQGIVPSWLPQFDNMRDIAINTRYGSDYQVHYNLPEPRKGYMMHVLTAAFPWWRAMIESGGIPGILWEDYQCDGFATESQKRELELFTRQLRHALTDWSRAGGVTSPQRQEWRASIRALPSYVLPQD